MSEQLEPHMLAREQLAWVEEDVRCRISGQVREFLEAVKGTLGRVGLVDAGHRDGRGGDS